MGRFFAGSGFIKCLWCPVCDTMGYMYEDGLFVKCLRCGCLFEVVN